MSEKKLFDLLIPEEYTDSNGEVRTYFYKVGTGLENKTGSFSLFIPAGVSLTGKVVMKARTGKDDTPPPADDAFNAAN